MKKKAFILISIIIFSALGVLFLVFSNIKPNEPIQEGPDISPVPIESSREKINISGINTNNFLRRPIRVNNDGDALFVENSNYKIVYLKKYEEFIIDISTTSADIRSKAEEEFLKKLGITKEEACRLSVTVNSPYIPNPNLSLPKKTLSFCINY